MYIGVTMEEVRDAGHRQLDLLMPQRAAATEIALIAEANSLLTLWFSSCSNSCCCRAAVEVPCGHDVLLTP